MKRVELGEVQKGMYFECRTADPLSYNISTAITLETADADILADAFLLLAAEQDALRSGIVMEQGVPYLEIHNEVPFELRRVDCRDKSRDEVKEAVKGAGLVNFNLSKAPLYQLTLIDVSEQEQILVLCIHHIICDGISLGILIEKLFGYYRQLENGDTITVEQNTGFARFLETENEKLRTGKFEKQREAWIETLSGAEPLSFPADFAVQKEKSGIGKEISFDVGIDLYKKLERLAGEFDASAFMLFLSAFDVLMGRYTQRDDIVISTPLDYRPGFELEETIGCFIYTLPLRVNIRDEDSFTDVLKRVSERLMRAYINIGYPNNLIARDCGLLPAPGAPSVFDISFVQDSYDVQQDNKMGDVLDMEQVTFPGDMMVILRKMGDNVSVNFQYKPQIFSEESIRILGQRFIGLLNEVLINPQECINENMFLLEGEPEKLLHGYNDTSFLPYEPQNPSEIFEKKVAECPDSPAVLFEGGHMTYAQVNSKANQLARQFYAQKKGDNDVIGLELDRSPELVIAILAALKAGCAYVPIDPKYPDTRKQFIAQDAGITVYVTQEGQTCPENIDAHILNIDGSDIFSGREDNLGINLSPFNLAYIEYTSGSTGKPKGVMIESHSIVNTVLDLERRFPLEKEDVYMLKTTFTFDIFGTEFYGWIVGKGALLILDTEGEMSASSILDSIEKYNVTHINFVPSMFRIFLEVLEKGNAAGKLKSLKWCFIGGEAVTPDIIERFNAIGVGAKLENVYGPTECTMWSTHHPIRGNTRAVNVSIGKPLNEYRCYIVTKGNQLQPVGMQGELCVSGAGLARGYLNREELTKERFVDNPFYDEACDPEWFKKMYRTGDLARWLPDGTIEFMGRIDFQVKIGGIRIELGEIENALAQYGGIVQAVAVVKNEGKENAAICAYYKSDEAVPTADLRTFLEKRLPLYMIPSFFVHKMQLPIIGSGKVNRNELTADPSYRSAVSNPANFQMPVTTMEKEIATIWREVLSCEAVGLDDNFFEVGGHSLALMQVQNRLKDITDRELSMTDLLRLPTVRMLAQHLSVEQPADEISSELQGRGDITGRTDIAIIGIAVDVPGAQNPRDFWDNMEKGKESIRFYTEGELEEQGVDPALISMPRYVKAKGAMDDIDHFDSGFFELSPRETEMTSPQLRVLYRGVWESLEDAGYYPGSTDDKIGVFVGGSDDFEWYRHSLMGNDSYSDTYQSYTMSTNHFIATRLSYKFNLKGPALSALTGCSTSLVTAHLACQSLMMDECDMAVAGGITIELPNDGGYLYEEGMMFSPDGHCRPFDSQARGTVFSNGMGLAVLKRLDRAIEDGDHIYAVIKGSAINNDGSQKVSFTAPSEDGQVEVIREAYRKADVDPETISYVEAHGTGTMLGDPIEVNALKRAFATDKKQYCILGSVKGNIGHTDTAAGIVGLIKVGMSLDRHFIPGTVNYRQPNPKISFADTPFRVQSHGERWEDDTKLLRAGINSFGVGGTNAHMVLEEAPKMRESGEEWPINLMLFSAKSESALNSTAQNVVQYLAEHEDLNLSNAAWTLRMGRKEFPYRKAVALDSDFRTNPDAYLEKLTHTSVSHTAGADRPVFFLFSGQGSQYQGMAGDLYSRGNDSVVSTLFRKYIDEVYALLPQDERNDFMGVHFGKNSPEKINETKYSQFIIFATEYALAKTMLSLGIQPDAMVGHSIGEVTAAAVAQVWSLEDAVKLVRMRGDLMQAQEPGTMLSVTAHATTVEGLLAEDTWLALCNTTGRCVVAGKSKAIDQLEKRLVEKGIQTARVRTSHAFHTPMMERAAEVFEEALSEFAMHDPKYTIISNVTGRVVEPGEMTSPSYWARHIIGRVHFEKNLEYVLGYENGVSIEIGPGRTLCSFAAQHAARREGQVFINLLRHVREEQNDLSYFYSKLGQLWSESVDFDWDAIEDGRVRNRVSLPTYSFDKICYPIRISGRERVDEASDNMSADGCENSWDQVAAEKLLNEPGGVEDIVIQAYKKVFGFESIAPQKDFFDLGGDSLKAVSLSAVIKKTLGIKVEVHDIFGHPSPERLASFIGEKNMAVQPDTAIKPVAKAKDYPLSPAQKRMYTFYLMDKESTAYNLPSATIIEGQLDMKRAEQAVRKLMRRHETLRTAFEFKDNQVVQIVREDAPLPVSCSQCALESDEDFKAAIRNFVKPFDLAQAPLFRMEFVDIGQGKQALLFDIHHIIADGTAVEILTRDFNNLYGGQLEPLEIQYKDYAVWQEGYQQTQEMKRQRDYWLDTLEGEIPLLDMPTDFDRPRAKSFAGGRVSFRLGQELSGKVREMSRRHGATNFMTMLSAWGALLSRYSGQEDLIVGTPTSGRTRDEVRETVGMFINMLAIRSFPNQKKSFAEYLEEIKQSALLAFQNQDYQFDDLVERLNVQRDLNRNAIYDVSFDYHNMRVFDLNVDGIPCSQKQLPPDSVAVDLIMTCEEDIDHNIECFIDYSSALYRRETIERMAERYKILLSAVTVNETAAIGQIDILTDGEKIGIFGQAERNRLYMNETDLISEMFEKNALVTPDKVALILADGRQFTYRELNDRANSLAWRLIAEGVKRDDLVGIVLGRDEHLIVSILGILKAGGAYVPMDPKFPAQRIRDMLDESDVKVLICDETRDDWGYSGKVLEAEEIERGETERGNPQRRNGRDGLAYVMFTSGSTGKPKGVMVKQEGLINFINDNLHRGVFSRDDDRVLCIATPSFDIFGFESVIPLCTGHSIYMADDREQLDAALVAEKMALYRVTHLQSPISRLKAFVESRDFAPVLKQLRVIIGGGENFPMPLLKTLQRETDAKLYNMYGPTETTITATVKDLTNAKKITIGEPIINTQIFVTNTMGVIQPPGVYGELCIAGRGLGRGYLNRPEETKKRFVTLEADPSIKIYRTGDRARVLPNGEVELTGRMDSQVKIRGYRVELGEIERQALKNDFVECAVAQIFQQRNGNTQLALFYCAGGENEDSETLLNTDIRNWLREKLPDYMVPSHLIRLERMPLLPNGKVDRKALRLPEEKSEALETKAPKTQLENQIAAIWRDVLGTDRVSAKDNFFDIGGNSFGLMLVSNRISEFLGYSVPLMQLFENPTIESLAKSLNAKEGDNAGTAPETTQKERGGTDIAVIGIHGRFPGADGVEKLWENMVTGRESISSFTREELDLSGISEEEQSDPHYVNAKGYLEDVEYFDHDFFQYSPKEAETMDPQIRLLHMSVWNALEDAGYNSYSYNGKIGLFAGSGSNISWMARLIGKYRDTVEAFEAVTQNDKDFITTKVAYKLNLKGPCMTVQTACSTSLVAIHQAVQSLRCGETDMAVAGGVSISYPRKEGYKWHEGMIYSKDGHCRPFSDDASGTVSGNGCAVVVLKKLERALADGDNIYAVIKGSAINNDGTEKIGYMAPSIAGQRRAIEGALQDASSSPEEIRYVEAHGTGTILGDPIEVEALRQAWKTEKTGFCALGSVKANIGHLDAAAGVTGFIKAAMVLNNHLIPPMVNYSKPNPKLALEGSPFYINNDPYPLKPGGVKAAVSSFGIGGTNAHVILEESAGVRASDSASETNLLVFSGHSEQALASTAQRVLEYLSDEEKNINLSDAAWTLQAGRNAFKYRKALVTKGLKLNAGEALGAFNDSKTYTVHDSCPDILFLLQDGKRHTGTVARDLYTSKDICAITQFFRRYVDEALSLMPKKERDEVLSAILGETEENEKNIQRTQLIENYAICMTWIELGVKPDALIGEGTGRLSAMAVSGEISLEDALEIVQDGCEDYISAENYGSYQWKKGDIPVIDRIPDDQNRDNTAVLVIGGDTASNQNENRSNMRIELTGEWGDTLYQFHAVAGALWCVGVELDWEAYNHSCIRNRVSLPGYVFDRIEHESDAVLSDLLKRENRAEMKDAEGETLISSIEDVREILMETWSEVLGRTEVKQTDDFLALGGDSLNAIMLASAVHKRTGVNIPVAEIFSRPQFEHLAQWIYSRVCSQEEDGIEILEKRPYYQASSAQKRMYAMNELVEDALPYNLASVYKADGLVDRGRLESAFAALVKRHESFRTSFGMVDGDVVQYVAEDVPFSLEWVQSSEDALKEEINKAIRPFDLSQAPLMRVRVIELNENEHFIVIDMHHIISDQTSIGVLLREFSEVYEGKENTAKPEITYKDFAAWQNGLLKTGEISQQVSYWREELKGELPVLQLETDFPRAQDTSREGNVLRFKWTREEGDRISRFAKKKRITPYMLMIASLKLMLRKYTGQNDIILGTAVAGRQRSSLQNVVGMFVNTLPIRCVVDDSLQVEEYLEYVKNKVIEAFENQDCQFDMILDELNLEKNLSRQPLFDIAINYINMGMDELAIGDLKLTAWQPESISAKYDLTFTILENEGEYVLELEYSTGLFAEDTARMFGTRFMKLIGDMIAGESTLLKNLGMITAGEQLWMLEGLNDTKTASPVEKSVVEVFEEIVRDNSNKQAISWKGKAMTYLELNTLANRLAEKIAGCGVVRGDKVAILLDQGPEQIVSILAILKSGAVYVPIDTRYPCERVEFMLGDSGAKLLLTTSKQAEDFEWKIRLLLLDAQENTQDVTSEETIECSVTPSDLNGEDEAYVIYTSGSTGVPKGTVICHKGIIRTLKDANYLSIDPGERMTMMASYTFDISVWEIFAPLLNGAVLVPVPREITLEMPQLVELFRNEKITSVLFVTSVFNAFVDYSPRALTQFKKIYVGGEALSISHVRKAFAHVGPGKIMNLYGPTETTMCVTYYSIDHMDQEMDSIPIGRAISNTTAYVLDENGNLLPPNVPGELCIGGCGVAKGYLNRPELTTEKFVNISFGNGERVYRTGDKVVLRLDGNLMFRGRMDHQIKLRGYRVELGEVEKSINSVEGVKEAIVVTPKDSTGDLYMAAYYRTEQGIELTPDEIRSNIAQQMPEYMVPNHIICIDSFPLTPNGKVDRKALTRLTLADNTMPEKKENEPRACAEGIVLEAMRKVLDNKSLGVKDNFFHKGGQSIKAIAFTQLLRERGLEVKVSDVFNYPTVEQLVRLPGVSQVRGDKPEEGGIMEEESRISLESAQIVQLIDYICKTASMFSEMFAACDVKDTFDMTPVQVRHLQAGSNYSGFFMEIKEPVSERRLRSVIADLAVKNQMLHCVPDRVGSNQWIELDVDSIDEIISQCLSCIDIGRYDDEAQQKILDGVCKSMIYSKYEPGMLPWRMCGLRLSENRTMLIWAFDHICFDGMSGEVIRSQLAAALSGEEDRTELAAEIEKYADYALLLREGPKGITGEEIADKCKLEQWSGQNDKLMEALKNTPDRQEGDIKITIDKGENNNIWAHAHDVISGLLGSYTGQKQVPLAIVDYGRSYRGNTFYNCVGEFLDIIPVLTEQNEAEKEVSRILELCREHSVNFLSLLYDTGQTDAYRQVSSCLRSHFPEEGQELFRVALYNFQGLLTEDERQILEPGTKAQEGNQLADLLITVNYNENQIFITLFCRFGWNREMLYNSLLEQGIETATIKDLEEYDEQKSA